MMIEIRPGLFWRLPIIRHIRYFWHRRRMAQHYDRWAEWGFYEVHLSDRLQLERIWRGDA